MASYPLVTLGPTISSTGITAPPYTDVYQSLIATFQSIYGSDIYVAPDSQDGQWIAALAVAINDCNQACISVYQSFSPSYAQGIQLSSLVKINGLARLIPSNSQAVGNVGGQAGAIITGGIVEDTSGNLWNLPQIVTIPLSGTIAVTVTSQDSGAIAAGIGAINSIYNPQQGWQTFSNTSVATQGNPLESDGALRIRQTTSVALPALGIIDSISAAVGNVLGVARYQIYENATGSTDGNGVPSHSISPIVEGGSVADIVNAVGGRKPPGIQTYGSTSGTYTDALGFNTVINFYVLTEVQVYFAITIKALTGYVATTGTSLISSLGAFVNSLVIGEDVYQSQASAVASLAGIGLGQTFYIVSLYLGTSPSPGGTSNIVIAFNAAAKCSPGNITLSVT